VSTLRNYREVQVVDYDPEWPAVFDALASRVRACLGDVALRIEHIGSTSVPGLPAKPVIDMDAVVRSTAEIPLAVERLATIGYDHEGDLGIPGREAFWWPAGEQRHHLYLLVEGARELRRHIAFRDALRADTTLRDEYAALKGSLADQHRTDIEGYVAGKDAFVESVLRRCEAK
jgi:GrpB-like predicted nucleotidyltransferase (UPF0157 family)